GRSSHEGPPRASAERPACDSRERRSLRALGARVALRSALGTQQRSGERASGTPRLGAREPTPVPFPSRSRRWATPRARRTSGGRRRKPAPRGWSSRRLLVVLRDEGRGFYKMAFSIRSRSFSLRHPRLTSSSVSPFSLRFAASACSYFEAQG